MLAQQIQQLGLYPSTLLQVEKGAGKATQIVGLVSATRGVLKEDLAQCSAEASLHWEYFGRPLDAFTTKINIAKPMPAPVTMLTRLRKAFKQGRGDTTGVSIGNAYFFCLPMQKSTALLHQMIWKCKASSLSGASNPLHTFLSCSWWSLWPLWPFMDAGQKSL